MKQGKIIAAFRTINRLAGEQLPLPYAYGIWKMREKLTTQWKFQAEQERKLMDELHGTPKEDGTVLFPTPNETKEFVDRMQELADMDVDIEIEPVKIDMAKANMEISGEEIGKLDGFVIFE